MTPAPARPSLPARAALVTVNLGGKVMRHATCRLKAGCRSLRHGARWSRPGRMAWRMVMYLAAPVDTRRRRSAAATYAANLRGPEIIQDAAFCLLEPADLPGVEAVLARCRELFDVKLGHAAGDGQPAGVEQDGLLKMRVDKREYLRNMLANEDLRRNLLLGDFALSDAVLGTAARYLGTIPPLNRVDLLYSVPRSGDEKASSFTSIRRGSPR